MPGVLLYTYRVISCYDQHMARESSRLNVTLDPERAEKLAILAERTHTQEGTLARSLLSHAIDEADVDARHVVELLDGIPGAFERAQVGLDQGRSAKTIPIDQL
jgi:hypothetical protein